MPEAFTDIYLITADDAWRALVGKSRPPACSLRRSTPPGLFAAGSPVLARQLWVDLDTAAGIEIPLDIRKVYFYSSRDVVPEGLPAGLFIRKPCSNIVWEVLWAEVQRAPRALPTALPTPTLQRMLPPWLLEFQELRLAPLCRKLITGLAPRLGYRTASLYLHHANRATLALAETNHSRIIERALPLDAAGKNLMTAVARTGRLFVSEHVADERALRGIPSPEVGTYDDSACLIAPLCAEGELWGVLNLSERQRTPLTEDNLPLDEIFTFLGRMLQHARAYDLARTEARIDGLTGLFNQRWMLESLEKEIRRAERFATPLSVLMIDLDELKLINDQHGHAAGDCVLRHVAERIGHVLRQFDGAARAGGDEFVIMLPATNLKGAQRVARRLVESIEQGPAEFKPTPLPVSASIGAAEWQPGWDATALVDAADGAMYCVKHRGCGEMARSAGEAGTKEPEKAAKARRKISMRRLGAK